MSLSGIAIQVQQAFFGYGYAGYRVPITVSNKTYTTVANTKTAN